jgi:hypothetical protein
VLERWLATSVTSQTLDWFIYTIDFIYAMMIAGIIFSSLHFKSNSKFFKPMIYMVSTVFGIFMIIVTGVLVVDIVRGLTTNSTCSHFSS